MHRDRVYKTSAYHKVWGTSKPCFSGGYPERLIFSLIIYIFIYNIYNISSLSLHQCKTNKTKQKKISHLGQCYSVPCKKKKNKNTREILNRAQFNKRSATDVTARPQPSIDTRSKNFTRCFHRAKELLTNATFFKAFPFPGLFFLMLFAVLLWFSRFQSLATCLTPLRILSAAF